MLAVVPRSADLKHGAPLPPDSAGTAMPAVRASSDGATATGSASRPASRRKNKRRRLHEGAAPSPQAAHVAAVLTSAEQIGCHPDPWDRTAERSVIRQHVPPHTDCDSHDDHAEREPELAAGKPAAERGAELRARHRAHRHDEG